jgi:hypothetical protein
MIALWAVVTMLAVSFQAHEHFHFAANSGTGHLVKHWHFEDDHETTSGTIVEKQQHGPDGEIQTKFQASKIFSNHPPALLATLLVTSTDEPRIVYIQADILPFRHGPPRQPIPARAPPQFPLL